MEKFLILLALIYLTYITCSRSLQDTAGNNSGSTGIKPVSDMNKIKESPAAVSDYGFPELLSPLLSIEQKGGDSLKAASPKDDKPAGVIEKIVSYYLNNTDCNGGMGWWAH